ncbi:histamine N-methyltransferase-like [Asterias amurensis]|uniref:histamine N-methyltransferase-like n=1 Tax=Asterias amurensis TaxID=7602 RepID=UPI003AB59414
MRQWLASLWSVLTVVCCHNDGDDIWCSALRSIEYQIAQDSWGCHGSQKPNYVTQFHPDRTINGREPATDLCQYQESPYGNSQAAEDEPGCYPWLYDNSARYMECLDEFQRFSDEWQGVQGWIGDNLAKLVDLQNLGYENHEMLARKTECGQSSVWRPEVYNMLGVGSGSGEVDAAILRVLLPRHPRVLTTVVEPDPSQMRLYRQLMVENDLSGGVEFAYHQKTSSQFITESIHNMTFDLIHMVHVLYHINLVELENTFMKYYQSLSPGGLMFITYESDKSSLARIRGALQPFKPGMLPYMSVHDIEKELCKGVPTYERYNIKGVLDVTACLRHDRSSANGDCLWDFITRVVDFRANAPKKRVQKAAKMLQHFSWREDGGRIMTNTDTAVIVVTKHNPGIP